MATEAGAKVDPRGRFEETRAAFCDAAARLLENASFNNLTIDDISQAAGLSRTAFYFYFRDKRDLLMAVTSDVGDMMYAEADRWWHGEGDREALIREAIGGVALVYSDNAGLMRAVTEVATYHEEVRDFWRGFVDRFITATAEHLRREQEAGRVAADLDADRAAEAVVWMAERCCFVYLARKERTATELVDSLTPVWLGALYGET